MNKNLILAIIIIAMIPGLFSIGRSITGSVAIGLYLILSIALLVVSIVYIILLYKQDNTKKSQPKKSITVSSAKTKMAKIHSRLSSIKISDDKAGKYIVCIVGLVGLVAILVMLL